MVRKSVLFGHWCQSYRQERSAKKRLFCIGMLHQFCWWNQSRGDRRWYNSWSLWTTPSTIIMKLWESLAAPAVTGCSSCGAWWNAIAIFTRQSCQFIIQSCISALQLSALCLSVSLCEFGCQKCSSQCVIEMDSSRSFGVLKLKQDYLIVLE